MDVVRNALKTALIEQKIKPKEIMHYAKICFVDRMINANALVVYPVKH